MKKDILKIIKNALSEDIGSGDITTKATVSRRRKGKARAIAKDDFIIAGIDVFEETFKYLDKKIKVRNPFMDSLLVIYSISIFIDDFTLRDVFRLVFPSTGISKNNSSRL